jgi:hypothetical protein
MNTVAPMVDTQDAVRKLLLREWDPIGVNHIPQCAHEYDTYADHAYVMLMSGHATDEIAAYLMRIATEYMSRPQTARLTECCKHVAEMLVALRS